MAEPVKPGARLRRPVRLPGCAAGSDERGAPFALAPLPYSSNPNSFKNAGLPSVARTPTS